VTFHVRTEVHPAAPGQFGTVFILEEQAGAARAEIWPAIGFNCFRWRAALTGTPAELLYADPQLFHGGRPTRSGIPVLFPFPNRIRDGRFTWAGREYQLPGNDSSGRNAIHGFACRHPWRVVAEGANEAEAWVTGEFQGSVDAPETRGLWPADYRLRLTFRLSADRLRLEATVDNPDRMPLPFGLGYHPYFRVAPLGGADCHVEARARAYWQLEDSLPTGKCLPVDPARDLTTPRRFQELQLDDVLTDLEPPAVLTADGLCPRGRLTDPAGRASLRLRTSPAFGQLVAFTPPHREAVCLEPYTCTTDAINLQARGVEAGLIVVEPGQQWTGLVELRCGAE
jgi:aldose 1-epimerase